MNKKQNDENEMLDEYDFSKGVRGKYVGRLLNSENVVILEADVKLEVAQRNPTSFTAPAGVDQLLAIGQQLAKLGTGDRRGGFFEAGGEMVVCDGDF